MPIQNGQYIRRTFSDIYTQLKAEGQSQLGDRNFIEGTVIDTILRTLGQTVVQNQEQSLEAVYNQTSLATATGDSLTRKAREVGVLRQSAIPATGVVSFLRDSPPSDDIVIQSGTTVSTESQNSTRFETTEPTTIDGPYTESDSTTYSTSNTAYVTKHTVTVDPSYRDSVTVNADFRTTNSSYTASFRVRDVTNNATIITATTTNTSLQSVSDTYDISGQNGLSDNITLEYQIKVSNSSGSTELTNIATDVVGQVGARANIEAIESGVDGNVGPDTITVMPTPPSGVTAITNERAVGDPSLLNTNGEPLTSGRDRESDTELRQRALTNPSFGGSGTADALELTLENQEYITSATVNTNQTASTVNGLDPYKTEVVIQGGELAEIVDLLYDTMSLPTFLRLQGGVNGAKETIQYTIPTLQETVTVPITRPTELTVNPTIDIVVTDAYAGDAAVKDELVGYVGGTDTVGARVTGLGLGENVIVAEAENHVEDLRGVVAVTNSTFDMNSDGTDDTTTDSDGVRVVAVNDSSVPTIDSTNVTVNVTPR